MPQLVTRVDDDLAAAIDALVDAGIVESRSAAVREGLEQLIDSYRRRDIGERIVAGYRRVPQDDDAGWSDEASLAMIADEPW